MDNSLKNMVLVDTAHGLYQWLTLRSSGNRPAESVAVATDFGFTEQQLAAFELLLAQPRVTEILRVWRPVFAAGETLSAADATGFMQQLLGALESVDSLLDYRCTAGFSEARSGHWTDYTVYRPGTKRGWGLHLTSDGSGVYNCLRRHLQVKRGDLVLLSPSAFYDYRRSADDDHWCTHWLAFQPDSRWSDLLNWPEIGGGVSHIKCNDNNTIEKLINTLSEIESLSLESDADTVRLRSSLAEQLLLRCRKLIPEGQRQGIDPRVSAAMRFIEANFQKDISVVDIATTANLSVSSLTRLFKHQTGLSVLAWRDEKRMSLACEKLTHSTLPIADIADFVGYADPLYFSRCFRRYFGDSPSDYRKGLYTR